MTHKPLPGPYSFCEAREGSNIVIIYSAKGEQLAFTDKIHAPLLAASHYMLAALQCVIKVRESALKGKPFASEFEARCLEIVITAIEAAGGTHKRRATKRKHS
jgi:hypothetical protein